MDFQALVITAIFTFGSTGVFGNSRELSTTAGDTVHIPCMFWEGTVRNIYWYYNDGTGPIKILTFFKGTVTVDAIYAYRATLHHDNSTLILSGITVNDEGTYRCDVDREGQTAVPNINTKLNVFSLTPDTLPEIAECTNVDCIIYSNKSVAITCALRNVYPVEDVKLIWYQDGQLVTSPNDLTLNDDGTIDLIRPIQVSESGNFTCNASFLTTQGAENAAVSVAVWITPESENTPGKRLTSGQTAGIVVCALAVPLLVIALLIVRKQRKENKSQNVAETDRFSPSDNGIVEQPKLTLLAKKFPARNFYEFCFQLDWEYNKANQVLIKYSDDCEKALLEILIEWKTRTGGHRSVLQKALQEAGVGGLLPLIAGEETETHPVQETTNETGPKDKKSSVIQGLHKTSHHTPQEDPQNEDQPTETTLLIGGNGSRNKEGEGTEASKQGNDGKNHQGEGTESSKQGNNGKNNQDQASNSSLPKASTGKQEGILNRSDKREMTSEEITELAKLLPEGKFVHLFNALEFGYSYHQKILKKHHMDNTAAAAELLEEWKAKTQGYTNVLDEALKKVELGGLRAKYKKVQEGSN